MLESLQSIHVLVVVFILAVLAIFLIVGFRGLCWSKAPQPNARQGDSRYFQLLRKTPI
jgi:hypothetical protein